MKKPVMQSVSITPNPTTNKQQLQINISVLDKEIVFSSSYYYTRSNVSEIYTGQEIGDL